MEIRKVTFVFFFRIIVISVLFLSFCPLNTQGQKKFKADSAKMAEHSATKATLYSAILPGLGQIYNRQYYKAPIIYTGFGVIVYFILENNKMYTDYRTAYRNLYLNIYPESYVNLEYYRENYDRSSNLLVFQDIRDTYHRWLEMSFIAFGALYILNIAEANVSAHFMQFDVSEDLTLRIVPTIQPIFGNYYLGKGLTLSLNF